MTSPNDKKAPGAGRGCAITSQSGLTLIYVIVGMVVISILGLGIHNMTSRTAVNQARRLSHDQVIYLARSGMNHAGAWYHYYMENDSYPAVPAKANAFQDELDNYPPQNLGAGEFSLEVSDGASPFEKQVRARGILSESTYTLYKNFDFSSAAPPGGGGEGNYALASPNADLTTANKSVIAGDVAGQNVTLRNQTQVSGDVVASGDVTLRNQSETGGDICAAGGVELENKAVVGGDINAGGSVTLANGAKVTGSIYAGGDVTLQNNAGVSGDIHSAATVSLGNKAEVAGSVYASEGVTFSNQSVILGDLHMPDPPQGAQDHVQGNIYTPADAEFMDPTAPGDCPSPVSPDHHDFTAGGADVDLGWQEDRAITPDSYGSLESGGKNEITLSAGTYYADSYFFEIMDMAWDQELYLDLSEGGITIFVEGDVTFDGDLDIYVSTDGSIYQSMTDVDQDLASRVYLETLGAFSMGSDSQWFGTIFAGNDISFGSDNQLIGSYLTASGRVENGNKLNVTHVPSDYAAENW